MTFADLPAPGIPPEQTFQSLIEFGALWDHVASLLKPKRVVEIGSLYGGTLWYWLQLPEVESVVSVDLIVKREPMRTEIMQARAKWRTWGDKLWSIEGSSQDPAVLEAAGRVADTIDFLFIDGDHTYEGVYDDFGLWSPLVRSGGLVAFHDTVVNGTRDEPGVRRLVAELKHRLPSIEWFDPTGGAGITAFVL